MNTAIPSSQPSRRKLATVAVVAVLVVIVAGVALVLVRLAGGAGLAPGNLFGGPTFIGVAPAKEVPPHNPDARGVCLRRADNTLIIGTNFTQWQRIKDDDTGEVRHEIAFDGQPLEKEVVVTRDTIIYRDATDMNRQAVNGKVKQVVKPGALDDINTDALVQVWGEAKGDRIVARVIVYHYLPA